MGKGAGDDVCEALEAPSRGEHGNISRAWNRSTQTNLAFRAVDTVTRLGARAFRAYNGFLSEKMGMDKRQRLAHMGILSGAGLALLSAPALGVIVGLALAAPRIRDLYEKHNGKNAIPLEESHTAQNEVRNNYPEKEQVESINREKRLQELLNQGDFSEREMLLIEEIQKIMNLSRAQQKMINEYEQFLDKEKENQKDKAEETINEYVEAEAARENNGYHVEADSEEQVIDGFSEEDFNQAMSRAYAELESHGDKMGPEELAANAGIPLELAEEAVYSKETFDFIAQDIPEEAFMEGGEFYAEPVNNTFTEDGAVVDLEEGFFPRKTANESGIKDLNENELLLRAYQVCAAHRRASARLIQRELGVSYSKALDLRRKLIAKGMLVAGDVEEGRTSLWHHHAVDAKQAKEASQGNFPYWQQIRQTVASYATTAKLGKQLSPEEVGDRFGLSPQASRQVLQDLVGQKVISPNKVYTSSKPNKTKTRDKKTVQEANAEAKEALASLIDDKGKRKAKPKAKPVKKESTVRPEDLVPAKGKQCPEVYSAQTIDQVINPNGITESSSKEEYLAAREANRFKSGHLALALNPVATEHIFSGGPEGWEIFPGANAQGKKIVPGMRAHVLGDGNKVHGYLDVEEVYEGTIDEVWEQVKDQEGFSFSEQQFKGWLSKEGDGKTARVAKFGNRVRYDDPPSYASDDPTKVSSTVYGKGVMTDVGSNKSFEMQVEKIIKKSEETDADIREKSGGKVVKQKESQSRTDLEWKKKVLSVLNSNAKTSGFRGDPPASYNDFMEALGIRRGKDKQGKPKCFLV